MPRTATADAVPLSLLTPEWRRDFRRRLLKWFARHRRELPWRETRDPYRIWLSEVMLQQTQVATVIPYYQRFLKLFPTIKTLAAAPEAQVLRAWEGLGYYRRARQLQKAAQQLVERSGGVFPKDLAEVQALPGIGRYTAGAIVSIAFDQPAPILEGNTIRLWSRLLGYREDVSRPAGQRVLWQAAEMSLPRAGAGEFNQALMELGALVCLPRRPLCPSCPVSAHCQAFQTGSQAELPQLPSKGAAEPVTQAVWIIRRRNEVLLRRYTEQQRWHGLWDFPRFDLRGKSSAERERMARAWLRDELQLSIHDAQSLPALRHTVTRFRITLYPFVATHQRGRLPRTREWQWHPVASLAELPMSVTGRKLAQAISEQSAASGGS